MITKHTYKITTGDLRHKIKIQKLTTVTNENGFDEEQWVDFATVWSSISNLSGREFWSAKAVQGENTIEFGIRYAKFIDTLDSRIYRIVHGTKIFNITFVDNVRYRNEFALIKTLELLT